MKRRVAVFCANRAFALLRSRVPLMQALKTDGWQVVIATSDDGHSATLAQLGFDMHPVLFKRGGISPAADLTAWRSLVRVLRRVRPLLIHHFNAKPMLYGTLAARLVARRAAVVNTVTGLGHLPLIEGWQKPLLEGAMRMTCRWARRTIFQNGQDREEFLQRGWISDERARVIVSSGVDTALFRPRQQGFGDRLVVLMVSRLLAQKGVESFLNVARRIREMRTDVVFQLVGEWEPDHPDAVSRTIIEDSVSRGDIEFLGYVDHIEEVLPTASLFVFPSTYREGVPRVVLEAAACGVPTVAVDAPGSRAVVKPDRTGWLVPAGSDEALTQTVLRALADTGLLGRMGVEARETALREFDLSKITRRQLAVYAELGFEVGGAEP